MRFKIAMCFALLLTGLQTSLFAQGGPPWTQAQMQSKINANNATMVCAASKTGADGVLENAQGLKSYVTALNIPSYWSTEQLKAFNDLIRSGDSLITTGGTYYTLGDYYRGKGNDNYAAANSLWTGGNYAAAAVYYGIAIGYYSGYSEGANATAQYDSAKGKYQNAYDAYNAAYAFWSANTPPPI